MRISLIKKLASVMSAVMAFSLCYIPDTNAKTYSYGDLNDDEKIDGADVNLLSDHLLGKDADIAYWKTADLDLNEKLNVTDLIYLKRLAAFGRYPEIIIQSATEEETTEPSSTETPTQTDTARENVLEVLRLVNEERAKVGAAPLTLNETLVDAAMLRAEEISGYFSHTRPDGTDCFSVLEQYGLDYSYVGENIAAGSRKPSGTMEQWINSQGHYDNIINSRFTEIGIGYVYVPGSEYGYYWVQLFREP